MVRKILAAFATFYLAATPSHAATWAFCDGCSSNGARQLARSVPPDQFGVSTINVLDVERRALHSFQVQVFYDYEFRSWLRFATPVASDARAQSAFSGWQQLVAALHALSSEPRPSSAASSAQWLLQDTVARAQGIATSSEIRTLSASAGELAAEAFRTSAPVDLRFGDGSGAAARLSFDRIRNDVVSSLVAGTLVDPQGLPLPEDDSELPSLNVAGDAGRVGYLNDHVHTLFGITAWLRTALSPGRRYRISCSPESPIHCSITQI